MDYLESVWISIEVCFYGYSQQYPTIRSDNDPAPTRRQAIIWTNDG